MKMYDKYISKGIIYTTMFFPPKIVSQTLYEKSDLKEKISVNSVWKTNRL